MKRLRLAGIIAGIFLVVYGVFGFFLLPGIIKPKIVDSIAAATGCPVTLGEVKTNPFALSLTLRDFALADNDGDRMLSFDELYVNLEATSILHRAYEFSALTVRAPFLYTKIRPDGKPNLLDMVPPDTSRQPDTTAGSPVPLIIHEFSIDSGAVVFEDRARPTPFRTVFDSLGFTLRDFTTEPRDEGAYSFEATTSRREVIRWQGDLSIYPMRSRGTLEVAGLQARTAWEYLQDMANFEATTGTVGFKGNYEADLSGPTSAFHLRNGSCSVASLELVSRLDSVKAVVLPEFTLSGVTVDYPERKAVVGSMHLEGVKLQTVKHPDGSMTLKEMFLPRQADTSARNPNKEWEILFPHIEATDAGLRIEDRGTEPPAVIDIDPATLTLDGLRFFKPAPATLKVSARVNGTATAEAAGTLTIDVEGGTTVAEVALKVSSLDLLPFQPYLSRYAKLELAKGALTLAGKYTYVSKEAASEQRYAGELAIDNFRVIDQILKEDFLRWSRLQIKTLNYSETPPAVTIREIVLRQPYARMIIGPDRVTNLQNIMNMAPADSSAPEADGQDATVAGEAPGTASKTRIDRITVVDGSLNFSDLSLTPNFTVGIHDLNGAIQGLSSEQLTRADVDLEGRVDKYAPALIRGQINPLSEEAFTDITMQFQGIELTTFSPYAGKFAGYKIDKGKLSLDLHYRLNNTQLDADNKIVLDQLTLGEEVEGPDVTDLPVRLAIALLKDSRGVIDLDIPVSGDINDPDFSVMPIVLKALLNLVIKAVTAPFALLGALFGGGDQELSYVVFDRGSDSLSVTEVGKLGNLAKALTERPGLRLDIRGIAAGTLDREGIAERAVLSKIRTSGPLPENETDLTDTEGESLLRLYRQTFNEDPAAVIGRAGESISDATEDERRLAILRAARARLIAAHPVSDDDLRNLARARADAVKEQIVLKGGISGERVFLLDVTIAAEPVEGEIRMELTLDAR